MGLLERALQYKQRINETGKQTLIDQIKGPADTAYIKTINTEKIEVSEIDLLEDIKIIKMDSDDFIHDEPVKESILKSNDENISIDTDIDEDIVLFDESEFNVTDHEKNNLEHQAEEIIGNENKSEINKEKFPEINNSDIKKQENTLNIKSEEVIPDNDYFEMPEFNDFGTLYEIQKEFIRADTIEEVYSTILFSIMGQLGVSSVSIIAPSVSDEKKWVVTDSHGIKISDSDLYWGIDEGILEILNTYKGVLDIEDIKNDSTLRDDYYKFTAVDARIITPLLKSDMLAGAILVGEKINSEDFNPTEIEFLQALSEIASSIIESLSKFEKISTELLGLRIEKEILSDVEFFQDSLLNVSSLNDLGGVIRKNFYSLGLENYCLFMKDQTSGDYYPAYFESDDLLGFSDSGFRIKKDSRLIAFLINKKSSIILENFHESSVIIDTFGRNRLIKMEVIVAYPFIISGNLLGFITIFKINPAVDITDIDTRIQKINRFLFPYLHRVNELDPELNKYNDLTAIFYEKIDNEIRYARDLNIPLSIILFTVKNYKRFYDRFGKTEFDKLSDHISEMIKEKLGAGDFSAKVDRNKFIIVLPGKEKRYSIMISNSIKNEILEKYKMSDFKLLITSLNSVFPEDGNDLFSILEVLE